MHILNKEQIQTLEENYLSSGIEHIKLMETAGATVARFIHDRLGVNGKSIAVVCGRGNNGGDGFACARKLLEGGATVRVLLAEGHPKTDDAIDLLGRSERAGIKTLSYTVEEQREELEWSIDKADIIVDAIFGLGFHGELDSATVKLIELINISQATVVSLDVPSGIHSDSGAAAAGCIKADYTVTFTAMKPGHVIYPGAEYCGTVFTAPIGIDENSIETVNPTISTIDYQAVRLCFQTRKPNTHKGVYGTLLSVCGSVGMAGAAVLSGKAAAQSGVGLVRIVLPKTIYPIVAGHLTEPVFSPMEETFDGTLRKADAGKTADLLESATACLIGCGLGCNEDTRAVVREVIATSEVPIVIDADAINAIADDVDLLRHVKAPVILTPHPGEMARLVGLTAEEVQNRRLEIATDFAQDFGVYLLLKGANTICAAPDGKAYINFTGNPGMAKGGSGDVLAGIIGSFLAQGMSPLDACTCAVYIHGAAGDHAAQRFSVHAMTPMDIIFELPTVFLEIER